MRYNKRTLIARRNKKLPLQFVRQDMTSFAGLTLIHHYLRLYGIHRRLCQAMKSYGFKGDYHVGHILFMLLILLLIGAERIQHMEYVNNDPLFRRLIRLTRIPHRTQVSRSLKQFTSDSLKALVELNSQFVIEKLDELGLRQITIDLDGTVISTRGNPTWALKGYNPIKRGAKSYFPLTAHIGETGHFISIINRPGNVHDSNRALELIKMLRKQLTGFILRFRADSAFCDPKVINYLLSRHIGFAIKAPFWKLLNLKGAAQQRKKWYRINGQWSYFWLKQPLDSVEGEHYAMILRKKLKSPKKNFQLDLFNPNNGVYEYSAVVTHSMHWSAEDLQLFTSGRSGQENSIGQLKNDFAFDHIPTNTYQANSAFMQISQMAYNLSISMQHSMGLVKKRKQHQKHTRLYRSMEWKTFKFLILNRAGRIGWSAGKKVLEMTRNPATQTLYHNISASLEDEKKKLAA
ncbi:IS1380 family transposase [Thermodesulfobacteriota bacterium]